MAVHATFVLPAPNGCNLDCPYCIIAQRKEADYTILTPEEYVHFLEDILVHLNINRVSIQGFEPLLPEVWALTHEMLLRATLFLASTSIVTNGTYLKRCARELSKVCGSVVVSLDGAEAIVHDKLRQSKGSFMHAVEGIYEAVSVFPKGNIAVNSVLLPKQAHNLSGMPELLNTLGVTEWIISPMIHIGSGSYRSPLSFVRETILRYSEESKKYGIRVLLSDELRAVADEETFDVLSVRSLETDDSICRLSPDGSCSRGKEILAQSTHVPKWNTVEQPHVFLERVFVEIERPIPRRTYVAGALARAVLKTHKNKNTLNRRN